MDELLKQRLTFYRQELTAELDHILDYWIINTPDDVEGGFYGRIDNNNKLIPGSPKGSVLNARILWSFAAAYNFNPDAKYLELADRAYQYIIRHFIDPEYGGVYWTVDHQGNKLDDKKQVYAGAFNIYAFTEYYKASGLEDAKIKAIKLYQLLVGKSYDDVHTGYFEAFTRDWQPISDLRLSAKDANEKKTMNTHLHVMEGYTNLYRIWPDAGLKQQIETLIYNFLDHFLDVETHHLRLFFDEDWRSKSELVSFGHDIEATWLLLEAAEVISDVDLIKKIKTAGIMMAEATIKGLDNDYGLWYEYEPATNHLIKEKHWWVQAEAMVGFFNSYQITGDAKYLDLSIKNWQFVKDHILDKRNGEWFWGINADGSVMATEDKAGLWKCPYHNSRACLEIIRRINELLNR